MGPATWGKGRGKEMKWGKGNVWLAGNYWLPLTRPRHTFPCKNSLVKELISPLVCDKSVWNLVLPSSICGHGGAFFDKIKNTYEIFNFACHLWNGLCSARSFLWSLGIAFTTYRHLYTILQFLPISLFSRNNPRVPCRPAGQQVVFEDELLECQTDGLPNKQQYH